MIPYTASDRSFQQHSSSADGGCTHFPPCCVVPADHPHRQTSLNSDTRVSIGVRDASTYPKQSSTTGQAHHSNGADLHNERLPPRAPSSPRASGSNAWMVMLFAFVLVVVALVICSCSFVLFGSRNVLQPTHYKPAPGTLIIYIFSNSNPEYIHNLRHFVREGVAANDGAEYVFVLQGGPQGLAFPKLPENAKYVSHQNQCFDLGAIGWLVQESGSVDYRKYLHIVWLNSSVRGPYLPLYLKGLVPWHRILTKQINAEVKLFGSTVSCSRTGHSVHGELQHPHLQTYLIATDQETLTLLLQTSKAFSCHKSWEDAIYFGEIGISTAVMDAGYSVRSMMLRYQNVDFTNAAYGLCNGGDNPLNVDTYDGVSVNPLEVMFIKVKDTMVAAGWPQVIQAVKYDEWSQKARHLTPHVVSTNAHDAQAVQQLEDLQSRGRKCFDVGFYRSGSPYDLKPLETDDALWEHFIKSGFSEGRPYRMLC